MISAGTTDYGPGTSAQEKADLIVNKIYETVPEGPALDAFSSVHMAPPEMRYRLFKDEAERVTGKSWECPAWQELQTSLLREQQP